uniref:Uncharacterized protein n=1 Tax=Setaria italica TaxID=4555 RepID=K4AHP7_SETIT
MIKVSTFVYDNCQSSVSLHLNYWLNKIHTSIISLRHNIKSSTDIKVCMINPLSLEHLNFRYASKDNR